MGTAKQNTTDIYNRNEFVRGRQSKAGRGNQRAKGYKFTTEQSDRLSKSLIGNKNKLGKKESLETRAKKSASAKIRAARDGMPRSCKY